MTIAELEAQAKDFVGRGFKAVKMRIGKPDIGEDVERVAAVRAAIGDRVGLMVDANQGLSVAHAIRLGRRLERSEEHTSELQSLMRISYAVFCLKKKTETDTQQRPQIHKQITH